MWGTRPFGGGGSFSGYVALGYFKKVLVLRKLRGILCKVVRLKPAPWEGDSPNPRGYQAGWYYTQESEVRANATN